MPLKRTSRWVINVGQNHSQLRGRGTGPTIHVLPEYKVTYYSFKSGSGKLLSNRSCHHRNSRQCCYLWHPPFFDLIMSKDIVHINPMLDTQTMTRLFSQMFDVRMIGKSTQIVMIDVTVTCPNWFWSTGSKIRMHNYICRLTWARSGQEVVCRIEVSKLERKTT